MLRIYIYFFILLFVRVDARKKKKKTFEDTILNINPLTIPFFSKSNSNKSLINIANFFPFYFIFRILLSCYVSFFGKNNVYSVKTTVDFGLKRTREEETESLFVNNKSFETCVQSVTWSPLLGVYEFLFSPLSPSLIPLFLKT